MSESYNSPSPSSSLSNHPCPKSCTPLDLFGSITTLVEKVIRKSDLEEFGNVPVIFIPGDDDDFFDEHQVSIQYNGGLLPDIILLTQCCKYNTSYKTTLPGTGYGEVSYLRRTCRQPHGLTSARFEGFKEKSERAYS